MAKERTEKAIMDTFLLLLNQNPLDKITVKDIVSACGISRNTFYYHYQDIYDLLRATFAAVVDRVLQENVTTWQESLRSCTSFALENRRAVYHVYRSAYREDLERSLYRVSEDIPISFSQNTPNSFAVNRAPPFSCMPRLII